MTSLRPLTSDRALAFIRDQVESGTAESPVIMFSADGGIGLVPCIDGPRPALAELAAAIQQGALGPVDWVLLVSDSYAVTTDADENPEPYAGRLGELFEAGDPRVSEAVMACQISPDGPSYAVQQTYVRNPAGTDGDQFAWGEIHQLPLYDTGGALIRALRAVAYARAGRPDAEEHHEP
jgi:hypothetical protein